MNRELETMTRIQDEKARETGSGQMLPLNSEGIEVAKHKRFTFDIVDVPTDPLR